MSAESQQRTLAAMNGFERYTKKTRGAAFLEEMKQVVPWRELCALVEPHYPKSGGGRRPKELEQMLRIYLVQQWFHWSDPAVEEALYESHSLRDFVGIDLGKEPAPDETTVCKFRHLLEEHDLGGQMLETVNLHLPAKGIRITRGTIVDATIIHAPSSTKNQGGERDPEMQQTRQGKPWYFGRKAHVGVDSKTKLVHSAVVTAANVSDARVLPELLHGEETRVWGDGGSQGQTEAIHRAAPRARGLHAPPLPFQRPRGRSGSCQEPNQVTGAQQGRACVWNVEAEVRVHEGALPRTEEEREPIVREPGAGEPVHGTEKTAGDGKGVSGTTEALTTAQQAGNNSMPQRFM